MTLMTSTSLDVDNHCGLHWIQTLEGSFTDRNIWTVQQSETFKLDRNYKKLWFDKYKIVTEIFYVAFIIMIYIDNLAFYCVCHNYVPK